MPKLCAYDRPAGAARRPVNFRRDRSVNSVCRSRFSERLNLSFRCHIERAGRLTSQSNLRQSRGRGCFEAPLARSGPPSIARHAAASPSGRSSRRRYDLGISVRERRPALGVELSPSTHGIKHALRQPVRSAEFRVVLGNGRRRHGAPSACTARIPSASAIPPRGSWRLRARALAPPPALGPPLAPCARTAAPSPASAHLNSTGTSTGPAAPTVHHQGRLHPAPPGLAFPAAFTNSPQLHMPLAAGQPSTRGTVTILTPRADPASYYSNLGGPQITFQLSLSEYSWRACRPARRAGLKPDAVRFPRTTRGLREDGKPGAQRNERHNVVRPDLGWGAKSNVREEAFSV